MGTSCHLIVTMVQRLTYRRRHSYATKSNKVRKVKTPGGVLTFHNVRKKASGVKCGDCGKVLQGLPALRPYLYKRIPKNKKTVARAYGGSPALGVSARGLCELSSSRSRRLSSRCSSKRRRT